MLLNILATDFQDMIEMDTLSTSPRSDSFIVGVCRCLWIIEQLFFGNICQKRSLQYPRKFKHSNLTVAKH